MKKIAFLLICWISINANAQNVLNIDLSKHTQHALQNIAEYTVLADSSLSLEEVMALPNADWKVFENNIPSFGYQIDKTYWVRFKVNPQGESAYPWLLWYDFPIIDFLNYYVLNEKGELQETYSSGRLMPFASRGNFTSTTYALPLHFERDPNRTYTIYAKCISKGPMILALKLSHLTSYQEETNNESVYYGIYFGCLIVMILYNLFVFVGLRDINYLYYVLTILCTLMIFATVSGYTYKYILPNQVWLNAYLTRIGMGLIVLTTSIFARSFLQTKKYSIWSDRALLLTAVLSIPAIVLSATDLKPSATNNLVSIQTLLLLVTGIVCWRKGNRYARFYVLAWSAYILGGILITLRNSGVLPLTLYTTHSAEIGSALEVILISLALSDRYRTIRKEKQALVAEKSKLLEAYNQELEAKVQERTLSLAEANEELQQVNEELGTTLETVEIQKNDLEAQQKALNQAYENIQASIAYAKRIQQAKLPQTDQIQQVFPDSFILFKPRDVVSGDFYWFAQHNGLIFIAVADCTGHGVPGALMSMIGSEILNDIVLRRNVVDPARILRLLHESIRHALRQRETKNRDGMDIALCVYHPEEKKLLFSGAYRPLVYVKNKEIHRIRGNNAPIGGRQRETRREFTLHTLPITGPTCIYLFSDGYQDQFGGEKGRKFMAKRFRDVLLEESNLPMEQQGRILEEKLYAWQNFYPDKPEKQIDDILVVGFRIE